MYGCIALWLWWLRWLMVADGGLKVKVAILLPSYTNNTVLSLKLLKMTRVLT